DRHRRRISYHVSIILNIEKLSVVRDGKLADSVAGITQLPCGRQAAGCEVDLISLYGTVSIVIDEQVCAAGRDCHAARQRAGSNGGSAFSETAVIRIHGKNTNGVRPAGDIQKKSARRSDDSRIRRVDRNRRTEWHRYASDWADAVGYYSIVRFNDIYES